MLKTHHQFFRSLFQLLDAVTVTASWLLAFWVRFVLQPSFLPQPEPGVTLENYWPISLALVLIWFLALQLLGAYKSWRSSSVGLELWNILKASALAFLIFVSIQHFIAREDLSRATLLLFFVFVTFGLMKSRLFLRILLYKMRKNGKNQRHVVYVGDGKLASAIEKRIKLRPELGFSSLGYIQVGSTSNDIAHLGRLQEGNVQDLERILSQGEIDQLLICLKNEDAKHLDQILKLATEYNVYVRIVPDISHYAILGFDVESFEGLPVISLNQSPLVGWNSVLKRITDVVYALFAILVFSVPMLILALIIKLTSRGPLFYAQERMGLDGKKFNMLKFRSMRTDAESQTGAVWAKENDPRVTWIGGIMRKTSLDELPQFFNVLMGDMSCVGPRPERPVFVEKFKTQIPGYMLRHKVKAGMTGWAQINGFRGNTSLEGRIEYDLYYISNWSLAFDLKIMFLTIFKGFINPNAY